MNLAPDAKNWHRLWSIRLSIIAAALGAAEATLPLWEAPLPDGAFAALASVVGIGAAVARVVKQALPHV